MKKRAISVEDKREKKQAILRAAENLFARLSYDEVSMARVATEAGVAKGTLFLYFSTKEELFLSLAESRLILWAGELTGELNKLSTMRAGCGEAADCAASSIEGRSELLRLLAVLHTRIEGNISLESAVKFRRRTARCFAELAASLRRVFPRISSSEAQQAVEALYMMIIGAQHAASPVPELAAALANEGSTALPIGFGPVFRRMVFVYLQGVLSPAV